MDEDVEENTGVVIDCEELVESLLEFRGMIEMPGTVVDEELFVEKGELLLLVLLSLFDNDVAVVLVAIELLVALVFVVN